MNFKVSCSVSLHVSFILKFVFKTQNLSALTAIFEGFLILSLHDFVAVDEDMFFAQCVLSDIISGGHSNSGQISHFEWSRQVDIVIQAYRSTDLYYTANRWNVHEVHSITLSLPFKKNFAVDKVLHEGTCLSLPSFAIFFLRDVTHKPMDTFSIEPVMASCCFV